MRQAKECKSMLPTSVSQISSDKKETNVIGEKDRAIALTDKSIRATIDTIKAMEQQEAADKAAQAALAVRMDSQRRIYCKTSGSYSRTWRKQRDERIQIKSLTKTISSRSPS